MLSVSSLIRADREFSSFLLTLDEQMRTPKAMPIVINGLAGGAEEAFIIECVKEARAKTGAPVLLLCDSEEHGDLLALELSPFLDCLRYRSRPLIFHNISASRDIERERLSVLSRILSGECDAVIATASAALTVTMPPEKLSYLSLGLRLGDVLPPEELSDRLCALGFARVEMVESAGQYARRGGILDLYPEATKHPVRIEFFGDEIDRMEYFDPITQRVTGVCEGVSLLPATEVIVDAQTRERLLSVVERLLNLCKDSEIHNRLSHEFVAIKEGMSLEFRDKYLGIIYPEHKTLLDYFDGYKRSVVLYIGTSGIYDDVKKYTELYKNDSETMLSLGTLVAEAAFYMKGKDSLDAFCERNLVIHINPFSGGVGTMRTAGLFGFRSRRTVSYGDNAPMLLEDLHAFRKGMYRVLIVSENPAGVQSLLETLKASDIAAVAVHTPDFDLSSMKAGIVYLAAGVCREGFELFAPKIAVLSMRRDEGKIVLENRRRARVLKRSGGAGQRLLSHADLSVGDYVVHQNYGIGLFEGIETVKIDGVVRDYITIRYAGTDKLFVPCDRLELIGKYIGARDKDGTVKLSRMGGTDWSRAKGRAKSAVKNIAADLIKLYAERQRLPGFAFAPDSEMEREFAEGFEYEETDSQLIAAEEIKADMMRPVPMNRLLCGDVGFGKTEVALRAAFKAIACNKQVAILVPTTILALQHFETILSRMRPYAVTVEMLSRFCTPKEQERILRRVKRGEIDILIGTHKLLNKALAFRDLGLLIIDEEQRFGVAQKEKLKTFAKGVDVLTLSATPIPRTLNMALNGISDMSILDEAPKDRLPVQTYVLEHDDGIIGDAIRRELARGGQVLYLYNKVEDIDLVAGRLMRAHPEARITWAHGQMDREELEDIWQLLVRGEIDVIVCTTIIETGVDLPSANTLIIENADRMGLSQLHQIRGRVGRGRRQAYAYFTYRPGKALSDIARKRLSAIREYAEFGAGFKIALRDLEIRGAGNLLGAEQHGYIESVGYDLYVKLLAEAVLEEQGKTPEAPKECTVDIAVDANIPEAYISHDAARMEMYKKISLITNEEDMQDVLDELLDRFGEPPRSTRRLVTISTVRALCACHDITRVFVKNGFLTFSLSALSLSVWSELFVEFSSLSMRAGDAPSVVYRLSRGEEAIDSALKIISAYQRVYDNQNKKESNDVKKA